MGKVITILTILTLTATSYAYACGCGSCSGGKNQATPSSSCSQQANSCSGPTTASKAVNVGNTICPVMGNSIAPGSTITYEHQGKIYNLCCAGCIDAFKADPAKYVQIINAQG